MPAEQPPLAQRLAFDRPRYNVPEPQSQADRSQSQRPPSRKIFHCVADETVLINNIRTIKKWAAEDAINLLVPLCTSDAIDRSKKGSSQKNANAREAIRFLETAQSGGGKLPPQSVRLQAPTEQYPDWDEAEKVVLAEACYSEGTGGQDAELNTLAGRFEQEFDLTNGRRPISQGSSTASDTGTGTSGITTSGPQSKSLFPPYRQNISRPESGFNQTRSQTNGHKRNQSNSALGVPRSIQSLLNCVLWQLHESPEKLPETNSVMLLTNDSATQAWAQKVGVAVNRIGQLDHAIKLEDKDFKNRTRLLEKTQNSEELAKKEKKAGGPHDDDEDEDAEEEEEIVFRPRGLKSPPKSPSHSPPQDKQNSPPGKQRDSWNSASSGQRGSPKRGRRSRPPSSGRGRAPIPNGPIDPNTFGSAPPPDKETEFKLMSGAPRGSARGRGKLWIP
ncbi:MAG: hypothetical protein M1837_003278 [Sclerophora amabilis]|nr:MAG: hypothetical protein M1837_003278 [Sclerophora amabilis]